MMGLRDPRVAEEDHMKPALKKQVALKGLLLVALAANISWEPFKTLSSYDAASGEVVSASPALPATRAEETAQLTPAPGARPAVQPRERSTTESVSTVRHEEARTWCGVAFMLRWEKVQGRNEVRGEVIRRFPENQVLFANTESGDFAARVLNPDARLAWEKHMETQARSRLGSECADQIATSPAGSNTSTTTNTADAEAKAREEAEKKKRLEADVKNCRRGTDGKSLDSSTRLECNLERLTDIEMVDEDDRKAKRDAQNTFNTIVRQINDDLKKEVKDLMMNDEPGEARQMVDDAVRQITEAGRDAEVSQSSVAKAVRDIQMMYQNTYKAVSTGKELDQFSDSRKLITDDLMSNLDMLRQQEMDAKAAGDQFSAQLAANQASLLIGQGKMLAGEYGRFIDSRIASLRGYQNQGWIDFADFTDFTDSTNALKTQLAFFQNGGRMTDSNGLPIAGAITVPQNFMEYRTQQADRYRSSGGVIPARPTINFTPGQMNTPSMPAMPSLNPTFTSINSGRPVTSGRY